MADLYAPTLAEQIAEVRHEIDRREYLYKNSVAAGLMTQEVADHRIEAMRSVLNALLSIKLKGEE